MSNHKRFNAQISCPLSNEMKIELEKISEQKGTTVSQLVREALRNFLGNQETKPTK